MILTRKEAAAMQKRGAQHWLTDIPDLAQTVVYLYDEVSRLEGEVEHLRKRANDADCAEVPR